MMTSSSEPTERRGVERLNEMAFGFKKTGALLAAIDLGLFTAIAQGAGTTDEVAAAVGIDSETADRLLIVCSALDLVRTTEGRIVNCDDVERYLVKDTPRYFGDYLRYQPRSEYDDWKDLTFHLQPSDRPVPIPMYQALMSDPDEARRFTVAGYNGSIALAHRLAKQFDFSGFTRWLDLGGGSGCYSIAACERNPQLTSVIMDFPNVLTITREFVDRHNLSDRISTKPGNFVNDEYPAGCDLVSFITPLQSYMPDQVMGLLTKAVDALNPGGTLLVMDYMLNDAKSGPLDPAFLNLQGVRHGHFTGRVNSGDEFRRYFEHAGAIDVDVSWVLDHQLGLVTGQKPL
ncbi:MAG: methyltransferase [Actinomycetia bacterium]|nr:methyltransferase [Actinomycetes bacterium]